MHILTTVVALAVIPSCGGLFGVFGKKQRVVVKGEVECHGKPAENVRLVLYVKNWLYQSNMDKYLTNKTGTFVLNGTRRSIWTLDPRVRIYHECHRSNVSDVMHIEGPYSRARSSNNFSKIVSTIVLWWLELKFANVLIVRV
ncbi:Transthyretin-like family protein [Teladorsagia circumcincta]|uniref:Transthyretin-like family protein n=2 Tax=Teladorsagia circumcincta TaxID=45464 RepID=A0A2G9UYU1_TELCI|nr:Transthyretin-like family protein [Teladorsagia circumcincta]